MSRIILSLVGGLARLIGKRLFRPDSRPEMLLIPSAPSAPIAPAPVQLVPKRRPIVTQALLPFNTWSRGGERLLECRAVVVHWVANPNASARGIRDYFAGLKDRYASTQYVVGREGEIILMVPENEVCYQVGASSYRPGIVERFGRKPNHTTIGIECCHEDWSGRMNARTTASLAALCADILTRHGLGADDLMLHHDFTGKLCHRWFVEHPGDWADFRRLVGGLL